MKKFITKVFLFIIGVPIVYLLFYISTDYYYNNKNDNNAIYIWGDSQTYQGIDLDKLQKLTNKKIYSYAKHGAGVYDFLVFSEKVPENSTILLGVSKLVQIRPKNSDRNMSGISISALIHLLQNGYTKKEILTILKKNKIPESIINDKTKMYKYSDTIVFGGPIELFEKIYKNSSVYLGDKQNLYKIGIDNLRKKQCNIIFIDFPNHSLLKKVEDKTLIRSKLLDFQKFIIRSSKKITNDTLILDNNKQVMHDLTHLNELGAKQVSIWISKVINKYERTTMYIKNCRDSTNNKDCPTYEIYCKVKN